MTSDIYEHSMLGNFFTALRFRIDKTQSILSENSSFINYTRIRLLNLIMVVDSDNNLIL